MEVERDGWEEVEGAGEIGDRGEEGEVTMPLVDPSTLPLVVFMFIPVSISLRMSSTRE